MGTERIPKLPMEIHEIVFECIPYPEDAQNYYHAIFCSTTQPTCLSLAQFVNFVMKSGRYKGHRKLEYLFNKQFDDDKYKDMFKINIVEPESLFQRLILKMRRFRSLTGSMQVSPCPSR